MRFRIIISIAVAAIIVAAVVFYAASNEDNSDLLANRIASPSEDFSFKACLDSEQLFALAVQLNLPDGYSFDDYDCGVLIADSQGRVQRATQLQNNAFEIETQLGRYTGIAFAKSKVSQEYLITNVTLLKVDKNYRNRYKLILEYCTDLSIKVMDGESSDPIQNAGISLKYPQNPQTLAIVLFYKYITTVPFHKALITDETGASRIQLFPIGQQFEVSASKNSFVSDSVKIVGEKESHLLLTLKQQSFGFSGVVIDTDSKPLSNIALAYEIIGGHGQTVRMGAASSGADGKFAIPFAADQYIRIESADDSIVLTTGKERFPFSKKERTITAITTLEVTVVASYEDGTPCLGDIRLANTSYNRQYYAKKRGERHARITGSDRKLKQSNMTGTVTFSNVARVADTTIVIRSHRDGFASQHHKIDLSDVGAKHTVRVTVRKELGTFLMGSVTIVIDDSYKQPPLVTLRHEDTGYARFEGPVDGSERVSCPPDIYIVMVIGQDSSWESPRIAVEAGKESRVDVGIGSQGSLKVTVQDEAGLSLAGVSFEQNNYCAPDLNPVAVSGSIAVTDNNGQAILHKQPVGWREYRVEVPGYLPTIFEYRISAGQTLDIGTVVLKKSKHKVKLELIGNWDSNLRTVVKFKPVHNRYKKAVKRVETKAGKLSWSDVVPNRNYMLSILVYRISISNGSESKVLIGQYLKPTINLSESDEEVIIKVSFLDIELNGR